VERGDGRDVGLLQIGDEECVAAESLSIGEDIVLEEYRFARRDPVGSDVLEMLSAAVPGDACWQSLPRRICIVSDGLFSHFCANACEVQQRVCIGDNGTVKDGGLFNQENVPADTLFWSCISQLKGYPIGDVAERLVSIGGCLQIGGDATVGHGFCAVQLIGGDE
jgi:CRISPR-associated protein Cmr4